jgi:hypothetical protein
VTPSGALVAHACTPSYSGGRDLEDRGSKPDRANRPYLEKPFTKIGLVEWLKVKTLSSNPSTTKKKKDTESTCPNLPETTACWTHNASIPPHSTLSLPGAPPAQLDWLVPLLPRRRSLVTLVSLTWFLMTLGLQDIVQN